MNAGWQDVVTFALVLAAALYLARGVLNRLTRKSAGGCASGCGGCPVKSGANASSGVVQIGLAGAERRNGQRPGVGAKPSA